MMKICLRFYFFFFSKKTSNILCFGCFLIFLTIFAVQERGSRRDEGKAHPARGRHAEAEGGTRQVPADAVCGEQCVAS